MAMPMFPLAPSPVGTAQRMGVERKGEGGKDDVTTSTMSHSDPFIADWLKIVGLSRERHQQRQLLERGRNGGVKVGICL